MNDDFELVPMSGLGPLHILMRFSDKLSKTVDTIRAHQQMILKKGSVWLAKAGKPMAHRHIATINRQCENHVPTYLYLVQRVDRDYDLYRGHITSVLRELPKDGNRLVPPYYRDANVLQKAGLWVNLSTLGPAPKGELGKLVLMNTASSARSALMYSMAGLFLVRRVTW